MSKPREVIARAIQEGYETRHLKTDVWLEIADAVIDALEGMEVSVEMYKAWCAVDDWDQHPSRECQDTWKKLVGAMRDE